MGDEKGGKNNSMQTHMFKDVQCHSQKYIQTVMDPCETTVLSQARVCILSAVMALSDVDRLSEPRPQAVCLSFSQ